MLTVIWFSECSKNYHDFIIFLKKCKQTAEISWLFSEMSKFQKILLNKVLAFFTLMSDHTLVLVVQPSNGQNAYTNIYVLLLTPYTYEEVVFSKFFIFRSVPPNFEFFEKKSKTNEAASWQKLKKHQNKQEISKFLL